MNDVLAVHVNESDFRPVLTVATAMATAVGATPRRIDVDGAEFEANAADQVLTALAEPTSVLAVLPGARTMHQLCWPVLERARKPVIVVPASCPEPSAAISRVLVPLDGTPEAAGAVAETVRLLAHSGVDLIVLHVFNALTVPKFWDHSGHAETVWQREFLARYCDHPRAHLQLRTGQPSEHVPDVAAEQRVDLIALGWSQHLEEGRAQTVRQTMAESSIPVLLVPVSPPDHP